MNAAQRREARIALAMLPIGAMVLIASALTFVAVVGLAILTLFARPAHWGWTELWCMLAAAIAIGNTRSGIEIMSAFDWRPLPGTVALSGGVVASWPGWWLG